MKLNKEGQDFIKQLEGLRLQAYPDGKNYSIGYGHNSTTIKSTDTITVEQADELFFHDVEWAENVVCQTIIAPIKQNQFNALTSLAYNIGSVGFQKSLVIRAINNDPNDKEDISSAFLKHVTLISSGVRSVALAIRRQKEIDLYFRSTEDEDFDDDIVEQSPIDSFSKYKSTSKYIHTNPSIITVTQLLETPQYPFYRMSEIDFRRIVGEDGFSNETRLQLSYNKFKGEEYPLLKTGAVLYIDESEKNLNYLAVSSPSKPLNFANFPSFIFNYLKDLYTNPNYIQSMSVLNIKNSYRLNIPVEYTNSLVSVWIYCKTLGKILNITPFCRSVNISVNGTEDDSFSIGFYSPGSDPRNSSLLGIMNRVIYTNGKKIDFQKYISVNDIVFIKFEELDCENKWDRVSKIDKSSLDVDKSLLKGNFFDFLGLVTNCTSSRNLSADDFNISITGGSFSKVLLDDEAIFFPQAVIASSSTGNLLIGSQSNESFTRRLFSDGTYNNFLLAKNFRSIGSTLKFFINQLSNIGIVNDNKLFESYGDEVSRKWNIKGNINSKELSEEKQKGIFQIIKLGIDPALENLCLVDSTVSNPNGNILSLFRKVVQYPFAEIVMDTYKDIFGIMVRRPPFDKESIKEYFNLSSNFTLPQIINLGKSSDENIFTDELMWENTFYTWYKFELKGLYLGMQDSMAISGIPIIYFPELVDLFGSKPLSIINNYIPEGFDIGDENHKKQAISSASYIIESTLYLPFTRKGTIVLNKGDRRFKKGTWFYYNRTGEIFYIDSVSNSMSIDSGSVSRTTILQVSRGIVWEHIDKYFKIFDLENFKKELEKYLTSTDKQGISREILVNEDMLNFFMKRKQFE